MMEHLTCHQVQGFTRLATRYLSSDTAKEGSHKEGTAKRGQSYKVGGAKER